MTAPTEHPAVSRYLGEFDRLAEGVPFSRRLVLREEVAEHLREAVPLSASDDQAAAQIKLFGAPADILGVAEDVPARAAKTTRRLRGWIPTAIVAAVALTGVASVLGVFAMLAMTEEGGPESTSAAEHAIDNPVVADPRGPERVDDGTGYFEYLAAIEGMQHPLPRGAEWPVGVPAGSDLGPTEDGDGVVEAGIGNVVAQFTWLCAWESEYLLAREVGDDERLVDAMAMITSWTSSDTYLRMRGPDDGWVKTVVEPMRFGDASGVQRDQPQVCAQAGILGVTF